MSDRQPPRPLRTITIGRSGANLYPLQDGVGLERGASFGKYLGGSATNVAVAAAQHGARSAVITRTGHDPFGAFVTAEIERLGVSAEFVREVADLHTPVTFCEMFPPDHFPLYFYREPTSPDLVIHPNELDTTAIATVTVFWATGGGLSKEPSRAAHHAAWRARGRTTMTVLDLDYRPSFWKSPDEAHREISRAPDMVTVAVGNQAECDTALGESDPDRAADALMERGVELAVIKQGPRGVLARTAVETVEVPPFEIDVVDGLGADDGFGGALCLGLLRGWSLRRTVGFANVAGTIVAGRRECSTTIPTTAVVEQIMRDADVAC